ncbi:hypothetical protein [Butyrivibrio sp. INlla14]|uniref:hypothetical protein n=1 Tax=Butyrivibrio sp. INlla14 TaxID=1520808 RepID=UPI000876A162|nr:hypothetical protein [Butyrivibrio sp. INlla14]SCX83717.1 hypothetical protein SAMN02910371_00135 [Butyrivibrio sp. INlla14]
MFRYKIYGLNIDSEVELIQLEKGDEGSFADVLIRQGDCKSEVISYLQEKDATKRRYDIGLDYSCFENKGGFYVIRAGREIIFECREGYSPAMVSGWILGYAMAMLLLQKKTLAIHCSGVVIPDKGNNNEFVPAGAVLISGVSGAGKSSLTRKLLERGYRIMADDVAAVKFDGEKDMVFPAFPYQKLCRNEVDSRKLDHDGLIYIDEDKDKFLVPVGDVFVSEPQPLKLMAFLTVGDVKEVTIRKLTGFEQFLGFNNSLLLKVLKGPWENYPEVINLSMKLASKCPVYQIVRPFEGDSQDIIADKLETIISEL